MASNISVYILLTLLKKIETCTSVMRIKQGCTI